MGDIIDLQAIRYNASVDDAFLRDAVALAMDAGGDALAGLIETGELAGRRLLRTSHRRVLEGLRRLLEEGCELIYVPGNHDALLRRHAGVLRPGLTLLLEDVYTTPTGLRLLVRHGDEYDRLLRLHTGLSHGLMQVQEHYSAWVNGLRGLLPLPPVGLGPGGSEGSPGPEAILEAAAALLASHWFEPRCRSERKIASQSSRLEDVREEEDRLEVNRWWRLDRNGRSGPPHRQAPRSAHRVPARRARRPVRRAASRRVRRYRR